MVPCLTADAGNGHACVSEGEQLADEEMLTELDNQRPPLAGERVSGYGVGGSGIPWVHCNRCICISL